MKQLLLALFCALPLTAMDIVVKKEGLLVPNKLGSLKVMRTDDGYEVLKNNARHKVNNYDVDPLLKQLDKKKLASFLTAKSGYIEVSQFNNGDYKLQAKMRLNGGGPGGATVGAYAGKFLVSFLGHGAILVAGALTGPAAPATILALEATFGPTIEALSVAGAITGGIAGGVATGPV